MPGFSQLKISLMDYDPLGRNDLIGSTTIDLERRYFDEKWVTIPEYPIETRQLRMGESELATGSIRLWLEVFNPEDRYNSQELFKLKSLVSGVDQSAHVSNKQNKNEANDMTPAPILTKSELRESIMPRELGTKNTHALKDDQMMADKIEMTEDNKQQEVDKEQYQSGLVTPKHSRLLWDIGLMPPEELELRLIIWEVHDCPIDDPEGLTDIFVTCGMSSYKDGLTLKTDTHIRSEGYVYLFEPRDVSTGA